MIKTLLSKVNLPFVVMRRSTFVGLEDEICYLENLVYTLSDKLEATPKANRKKKKVTKK